MYDVWTSFASRRAGVPCSRSRGSRRRADMRARGVRSRASLQPVRCRTCWRCRVRSLVGATGCPLLRRAEPQIIWYPSNLIILQIIIKQCDEVNHYFISTNTKYIIQNVIMWQLKCSVGCLKWHTYKLHSQLLTLLFAILCHIHHGSGHMNYTKPRHTNTMPQSNLYDRWIGENVIQTMKVFTKSQSIDDKVLRPRWDLHEAGDAEKTSEWMVLSNEANFSLIIVHTPINLHWMWPINGNQTWTKMIHTW